MPVPRLAMALATALTLSACSDHAQAPTSTPDGLAPVLSAASSADRVADRYIVVLKPGADGRGLAERTAREHGGTVHYVYQHALNGFAATLRAQALEALRRNPQVDFIEQDQVMYLGASQSPATWGLDRADQRNLPLNNTYNYWYNGSGVHVYVIDTGLRADHAEFTGRVGNGWSYIADGLGAADCGNGHGTHVAGTIAGSTWGVAKGATVHPVRVFDCNGTPTSSSVVAGVDGVTANAIKPAVANMSLWGGASTALDNAVRNSIASGVTYVVIAGNNSGQNACNYSPARVAEAITVASTTSTDARSSFSNVGSCVDLFAPGSSITSAGISSSTSTSVMSGTSMAAPHVAGAAALYLQTNPSATAAQVHSEIVGNATTGKVTSAGTNSPNRLLFSLRRLTTSISGPTYISTEGVYTWTVTASGGETPGSYSYVWDMIEHMGSQSYTYNGVSTTTTYSRYVGPSYMDFTVTGRVTSGTETISRSLYVDADVPCLNEPCPF